MVHAEDPDSTSFDPHRIIPLIRSSLVPFHAKSLPTTLQLFAHLQLLSSQIRSEASRAIDAEARLIGQLEAEGIDETEWLKCGALYKADGKALLVIAKGEDEGKEGLSREDWMMELSLKLRFYVSCSVIHVVW